MRWLLLWLSISSKEGYLKTEVFSHIGFEAKHEMKPYYNIVHKAFQVAILRKLKQFFQDAVTHVSSSSSSSSLFILGLHILANG